MERKKTMVKKAKNKSLGEANKVKNDEFYTPRKAIENELGLYSKNYFKGKVIFCNCDDPQWSEFFFYFSQNFDFLEIKKLITTHYEENKSSYMLVIERDKNGKMKKPIKINLKENGDFRSQECIELLKESDMVVTNPPFSLFREYVAQLIEHKKKFLIIGNLNALTYKEIFRLFMNNKIWLGITSPREFKQPNGIIKKFGNITWFTNLKHKKRNEKLILYKKYRGHKKEYSKYDNFNAINVDKVSNIPKDYDGAIGVPITFLDKYNPKQFKILGILHNMKGNDGKRARREINSGQKIYCRVIIKKLKVGKKK